MRTTVADPVNAVDVIYQSITNSAETNGVLGRDEAEFIVEDIQKACGWDGTGEPPDVVIRHDGTLTRGDPLRATLFWRVKSEAAGILQVLAPEGAHPHWGFLAYDRLVAAGVVTPETDDG